jgi:hypothetical protein
MHSLHRLTGTGIMLLAIDKRIHDRDEVYA